MGSTKDDTSSQSSRVELSEEINRSMKQHEQHEIHKENDLAEIDRSSTYGFDRIYLRRFLYLNKFLFPALRSRASAWILVLILFRYYND